MRNRDKGRKAQHDRDHTLGKKKENTRQYAGNAPDN
jgi:hypothetical protein